MQDSIMQTTAVDLIVFIGGYGDNTHTKWLIAVFH